jgi:hypothetical protein
MSFGAGFLQEPGEINGRGSGADDSHPAVLKAGDICMLGTVREVFRRQARIERGDVAKVSDAGSHHDPPGKYNISILRVEAEAAAGTLNRCYVDLFELGNEALLERDPVGHKRFNGYREANVCVRKRLFPTILSQSESRTWIVKVGGKAVGFEQSPGWHVVAPAGHDSTKNTVRKFASVQVRRNGEPIRACSNDRDIDSRRSQGTPPTVIFMHNIHLVSKIFSLPRASKCKGTSAAPGAIQGRFFLSPEDASRFNASQRKYAT